MEIICYAKNDVPPKAPTKTEYIYEYKITNKKNLTPLKTFLSQFEKGGRFGVGLVNPTY